MSRRGVTELEVAGEVYEVVPTMELLDQIEGRLRGAPGLLLAMTQGEYTIREIATFAWLCAKHSGGGKIKIDDVYAAVLEDGVPKYVEFAIKLLSRALSGSKASKASEESDEGEAPAGD